MRKNPFFEKYSTPHETIPFHLITIADIEKAIFEGIKNEEYEIAAITKNSEEPTFENTIVAFDRSGELLQKATAVMYNLLSAETNDELDALSQKMAPLLSDHNSNIMLNKQLFRRINSVWEHYADKLEGEDRILLEKTYEAFERSGAVLPEEKQQRFREISAELSQLSLSFSKNNLKETNSFFLHITAEKDLSGLPGMQIQQAADIAKEKNMPGWVITLQAPSYIPFMTYADNRRLRKQLYMAYNTKCTHDNSFNNYEIVRRIINLRQEKAKLLGYPTYADYILKRRMAEKPEKVYDLLNQLITEYKSPAEKELADIADHAKRLEGNDFVLQPWDYSYYSHKLQMERFNLDSEMLRPYFELSKVKRGIFDLATRLYGITFQENKDIPVYHPDVSAYEVYDANHCFLAILYTDFHPRTGKQGGAWMTTYKEQWKNGAKNHRPHVAIVTNFTLPTENKPALLTLSEVETFLHEFGHALHGIFANTKYQSLSGTNVFWDFVELPSQFMENYAVEKEFLRTFAYHYQTGELIPDELIERIIESRNFNAAYACMRQVSFGLLDMAYYTLKKEFSSDIREFEKKAWHEARLLPDPEETCMTVQFGHIMSGGYAAGYYSYKWAEVLDADAFALFKENGIFDRETAEKFRCCILSKGATEHPMTLYKKFRGKEPSIEALLTRNGIIRI
ncbi:MAG TPA: M3 family metallopeptidase [Alloprevotella sp.]|nr:M3 family metallopeptidase [Alloprevotella sp.]